MRGLFLFLFGLLLLAALFAAYGLFAGPGPGKPALVLASVSYSKLPGWEGDDMRPALAAFGRSCEAIAKLGDSRPLGGDAAYGLAGDWKTACSAYAVAAPGIVDAAAARAFVKAQFAPFAISNSGKRKGLFTGYYEAEARGSLQQGGIYQTPLLKRPADLVQVDLGLFGEKWKGQRTAGRVVEGRLVPYASRAEIEHGALDSAGLGLVWLSDPVDAFYIHIQGSGRVELEEGGYLRVGYDGQNGHPYTAIGRVLLKMGALERGNVSMQTIRAWLHAHPEEGRKVMEQDASYIFFKALPVQDPALGPLGAQEVPLTPDRSLAVDRKFHALGVPMWLETSLPGDNAMNPGPSIRRLMIAQDTGGAIQGPVRGDVFFGFGENAAFIAGRMKQEGRLWVLLPKAVAARAQVR